MRIATFNILGGRALHDDSVDEQRYAGAIAALDADILGLQEVDRDQPRSGGADLTGLAAQAMGAVSCRFVPALSGTPGRSWSAALDEGQPDGPGYGIALLSRYPVESWRVFRLPRLRTRVPHLVGDPKRPALLLEEPRVAVLARLETPLGPMRVVTTHLSYLPWWNGHQLRSLMRRVGTDDRPTVLAGDLNMRPARAGRITGMRALSSGHTFANPEPTAQLDHLLVDGRLTAVSGGQVQLPVSDHRALVADLAERPDLRA